MLVYQRDPEGSCCVDSQAIWMKNKYNDGGVIDWHLPLPSDGSDG